MSYSSRVRFVADPAADVVLQSRDKINFPVRRVSLQANSDVFDGMFDAACAEVGDCEQDNELPVIKLEEKGRELDVLLRLFVLNQIRPDPKTLEFDAAVTLFKSADKYGFQLVEGIAVARLHDLASAHPIDLLAVGLSAQHLDLTRVALSNIQGDLHFSKGRDWWTGQHNRQEQINGYVTSGKPLLLSRLTDKVLGTLSVKSIKTLLTYEERVLLGQSTWAELGKQFTLN